MRVKLINLALLLSILTLVACGKDSAGPYTYIYIQPTEQNVWSYSRPTSIGNEPIERYGDYSIDEGGSVIFENGVTVKYSNSELSVNGTKVPSDTLNTVVTKEGKVIIGAFIRDFE